MTNQEIFSKVATHLLTQNEKAQAPRGIGEMQCRYRVEDASGKVLRCAVGCLIPDAHYTNNIEGEAAGPETWRLLAQVFGVPKLQHLTVRLLTDLQCIHDQAPVRQWR